MQIRVAKAEETIIHLIGNFDKPTAKETLLSAVKDNPSDKYLFDLTELSFAGSYLVSTLLQLYRENIIRFSLINVPLHVFELLEITGVTKVVTIYKDEKNL